jgi:SAM-dependent methyltransferase
MEGLSAIDEEFDCITLIEVLEHLDTDDIRRVLDQVGRLLRPGGSFIVTTPNYASTWPLLEVILNRLSDVSYEEQHLTRFRYASFERTLRDIDPAFFSEVELEIKTTSHFVSPFLGLFSERLAMGASRLREPMRWRFPFGNLILARFWRKRGPKPK